jgi:hypothetical protein
MADQAPDDSPGPAAAPLLCGLLLALPALGGERWPLVLALLLGLAVFPFRIFVRLPFALLVPAAAFAGGMAGGALAGTEIVPPGTVSGNLINLLTRTARHGLLQAIWIGGGLWCVWYAFHRPLPGQHRSSAGPIALGRAFRVLRPFRLVALLLVMFVTPRWRPGRDARAYRQTLHADLVSFAYFQGRSYETTGAFAESAGRLPGFRPAPGVTVEVQIVDSARWRARATHRRLTTVCAVLGGGVAPGVAAEPSDPVCRERRRWF